MPRPSYPADKPDDCADCGAPCRGRRCAPCEHARRSGMPIGGTPVKAPDGRAWRSVAALAREWGTSHQAAYNHMVWNGDHWLLLREPNPANIGARHNRRPAPARRIPHASAD